MKNRLYRMCYLVRPKAEHPNQSIGQLSLCLYLFCASGQEANERATAIMDELPYEYDSAKVHISHGPFHNPDSDDPHSIVEREAVESAFKLGFAVQFYFGPEMPAHLFEQPPAG